MQNCLASAQVDQLTRILNQYESEEGYGYIFLKANGDFCAGHNLLELLRAHKSGETEAPVSIYAKLINLQTTVWRLKKPVIGCFSGFTIGTGAALALNCAHRLCTPDTIWALHETDLGLAPVGVVPQLLNLKHPGLGYYLALTGRRLKGGDLIHAGIGTHFSTLPGFDLIEANVAAIESGLNSTALLDRIHEGEVPIPHCTFEAEKPHIEQHFGGLATIEEIKESLKTAGNEWSKKTLKRLEAKSPIGLLATETLFNVAQAAPARPAAIIEMTVMTNLLSKFNDPWEGISARVRENRTPVWEPLRADAMDALLENRDTSTLLGILPEFNFDRPIWDDHREQWEAANPDITASREDASYFTSPQGQSVLKEIELNIAGHTPWTLHLDALEMAQQGEEEFFH